MCHSVDNIYDPHLYIDNDASLVSLKYALAYTSMALWVRQYQKGLV